MDKGGEGLPIVSGAATFQEQEKQRCGGAGQRERSWILVGDSSVNEGGGSGQCWGAGVSVSEWTVIEFTTRGRWRAVGRILTEFERCQYQVNAA